MEKIEKREIESLLRTEEWPAISIFMPVSRIGDPQDPLRYKNFIADVEARLIEEGMRATMVRDLLKSEIELAQYKDYWQHLGADGLAVFRSAGRQFRYPLPDTVNERVVIGERFHVRPLLPLLINGRYLVLALSRNRLRLFSGDRYGLTETDLPENTPSSIEDALQIERERSLQFHSRTSSATSVGGGRRPGMFHGHGAGLDDLDIDLARYYQLVDRALFPRMETAECPVILAGTEEQHAVYRQVTRSQTLLPEGIAGNVAEIAPNILHARSWAIARGYFSRALDEAADDYRQHLGGILVTDELSSVLLAACDGRVENLFVNADAMVFGRFDPERREVTVARREQGRLRELLDEAVFWTLQQKGRVYARPPGEMPVPCDICARLRY